MKSKKHKMTDDLVKVTGVFNYRGLIVERTTEGYKVFGRCFKTINDIDKEIIKLRSAIQRSIIK